jgi:hypothetical protein
MVFVPEEALGTVDSSEPTGAHHKTCTVNACSQNYSPSLGYFSIEKNNDYWHVTGNSSLRISRNPTQVICSHENDNVMFVETFHAEENAHTFRCPRKECDKTMKIPVDGPPASWLVDGFFASA